MNDNTALPRLLVLMGSGETSPTMVRTHRDVLARLGPAPVPAVLLDTPFGFQSNADDIVRRAVRYFQESVGTTMTVASYRRAADATALDHETTLGRLRDARYVFSGPGSPTYALRQWSSSSVPAVLREKVRAGGCVAFASAAALTLGRVTLPVYEIYKAGADPVWLPGIDLLDEAGLSVAVIPHYDNAEGGTHDTRYCYLGEERLSAMEHQLPAGTFVLGIDEHTACILDLDAGTAAVAGLGGMTVRAEGRSHLFPSGSTVSIADVAATAERLRSAGAEEQPGSRPDGKGEDADVALHPEAPISPTGNLARMSGGAGDGGRGPRATSSSPLLATVARREAELSVAVEGGDLDAAVSAVLSLESDLVAWSADTLQSDEIDRGRAALRSMILRLADAAVRASQMRAAEAAAPLVDALLDLRADARAARRWDEADAIRRRLEALGIEVRDEAMRTSWSRRS